MHTNEATVTIKGLTYDILTIDTAETHRASDRPKLGDMLEARGIIRDMSIVRPNGSLVQHVYEFANDRFSKVTSLYFHVTPDEKAALVAKLGTVNEAAEAQKAAA